MTLFTTRARQRAAAGRRERAAALLRANLAAVTQAIKAIALQHAKELTRYCAGLEAQPERWMHALTIAIVKALGYRRALEAM